MLHRKYLVRLHKWPKSLIDKQHLSSRIVIGVLDTTSFALDTVVYHYLSQPKLDLIQPNLADIIVCTFRGQCMEYTATPYPLEKRFGIKIEHSLFLE